MIPEIELLTVSHINWPAFRSTLDKALNVRPDIMLAQCPVTIENDAEFLLYLAYLNGISIKNPLNVLRTLPHHLLEYLHYTIMVACSEQIYYEFIVSTRLQLIMQRANEVYISLVTGPLSEWYDTIVLNLTRDWHYTMHTRLLVDKFLLLFERRGLKEIFANYPKRPVGDGTFLLEIENKK